MKPFIIILILCSFACTEKDKPNSRLLLAGTESKSWSFNQGSINGKNQLYNTADGVDLELTFYAKGKYGNDEFLDEWQLSKNEDSILFTINRENSEIRHSAKILKLSNDSLTTLEVLNNDRIVTYYYHIGNELE